MVIDGLHPFYRVESGAGERSMPSVCFRVTILPAPSRFCSYVYRYACDVTAYDTTVF